MNKLAKGAVATALGTALLLGGAGTLALWNDSVDLGAGQDIASGVLTLDVGTGAWDANPALWVPGDAITYTTAVAIVAQGDNLAAELSIDPASITGDPALLAALDTSMAVSNVAGGALTPVAGRDNVFTVVPTSATSGAPVTAIVTVTIDFPASSVSGLVAQGERAYVSNLQLLLNQVAV
ncbi:alternate-type signal peptide domain-containing protein [Cellulomonas hominis]